MPTPIQEHAPAVLQNVMKSQKWKNFLKQIKEEVGNCSRQVAEDIRREGSLVDKMTNKQLITPSGSELGMGML